MQGQCRLADLSAHKAVITKHQDPSIGQLQIITLNNEEAPEGHTDRHIYPNKSAAEQATKARLDGDYLVDSVEQIFTQSGWSATVECTGGNKAKPASGDVLDANQGLGE